MNFSILLYSIYKPSRTTSNKLSYPNSSWMRTITMSKAMWINFTKATLISTTLDWMNWSNNKDSRTKFTMNKKRRLMTTRTMTTLSSKKLTTMELCRIPYRATITKISLLRKISRSTGVTSTLLDRLVQATTISSMEWDKTKITYLWKIKLFQTNKTNLIVNTNTKISTTIKLLLFILTPYISKSKSVTWTWTQSPLRSPRSSSKTRMTLQGTSRDSRQSTRLRSARTGNSQATASSETAAHLHMAIMNSSQSRIFQRTTRPSFARDSMKSCTVPMVLDVSSSTRRNRSQSSKRSSQVLSRRSSNKWRMS
jgi:hypothetical protein